VTLARLRYGGLAVLVAAAIAFPLAVTNQEAATLGFDAMIFVAAAAAWNMFSGYSGYISLGHAVFFGSGAYAAGIAARDWQVTGAAIFALLPLSAAVAALIAVPFGLVALRVRRHTFVVVTIAIFFIFQLVASNIAVTNGTSGLNAPFLLWSPVTFDDRFYYVALALAVLAVALSWLIRGSRFGLQLRAIRDDEDRAAGLGVRAMPVKLAALVISGAVTGLAGAVWFFFIGQVYPQSAYDPIFDLTVALMAFLGGLGSVAGPVLGALVLEPAQQYLTQQLNNAYLSEILLGVIFLLVILVLPRGVIPTAGERLTAWRAMRMAPAPAGGAAPSLPAPPATAGEDRPAGPAHAREQSR